MHPLHVRKPSVALANFNPLRSPQRNRCTSATATVTRPATATVALPEVQPLRFHACILCVSARASLRSRCALWPFRAGLRSICGRETLKSTSRSALQPLFSGMRRISALKKWVNSRIRIYFVEGFAISMSSRAHSNPSAFLPTSKNCPSAVEKAEKVVKL